MSVASNKNVIIVTVLPSSPAVKSVVTFTVFDQTDLKRCRVGNRLLSHFNCEVAILKDVTNEAIVL